MDSVLKKGLFLVTISSLVMGISPEVQAADTDSVLPGAGIEEVLNDYDASDHKVQVKEYLVPTEKGEYSDMAFANVHSFLYIRSEPTTDSEWVGKLYTDYAAKITGPVGEWTKVESGNVTGYVYSRYITVGNEAQKKAEELVQNNDTGNAEDAFTYAESREEEAARLQKKQEEQKAQAAGNGQAIVDYACQFIGNPYVWGGTSLTNGADCSGFVLSVFRNYGISLPHSSRAQANCGTKISLSELKPGDLVFYGNRSGINHVAIYVGGGQVVHASNPRVGITISGVSYRSPVKAVRVIKD